MSLTNEELILLDNFIYLDYTVTSKNKKVDDIVTDLLNMNEKDFKNAVTDKQYYYCGDMVNGMSTDDWKMVLTAISNDPKLMNMSISNIKNDSDTGFKAA